MMDLKQIFAICNSPDKPPVEIFDALISHLNEIMSEANDIEDPFKRGKAVGYGDCLKQLIIIVKEQNYPDVKE